MIAIKKLVMIDLPPHYVVVEKRDRSIPALSQSLHHGLMGARNPIAVTRHAAQLQKTITEVM